MLDWNYINSYNFSNIKLDNNSNQCITNFIDNVISKQKIVIALLGPIIIGFNYKNEKVRKNSEDKKIYNTISRLIVNNFLQKNNNAQNIIIKAHSFSSFYSFTKRIVKEIERFNIQRQSIKNNQIQYNYINKEIIGNILFLYNLLYSSIDDIPNSNYKITLYFSQKDNSIKVESIEHFGLNPMQMNLNIFYFAIYYLSKKELQFYINTDITDTSFDIFKNNNTESIQTFLFTQQFSLLKFTHKYNIDICDTNFKELKIKYQLLKSKYSFSEKIEEDIFKLVFGILLLGEMTFKVFIPLRHTYTTKKRNILSTISSLLNQKEEEIINILTSNLSNIDENEFNENKQLLIYKTYQKIYSQFDVLIDTIIFNNKRNCQSSKLLNIYIYQSKDIYSKYCNNNNSVFNKEFDINNSYQKYSDDLIYRHSFLTDHKPSNDFTRVINPNYIIQEDSITYPIYLVDIDKESSSYSTISSYCFDELFHYYTDINQYYYQFEIKLIKSILKKYKCVGDKALQLTDESLIKYLTKHTTLYRKDYHICKGIVSFNNKLNDVFSLNRNSATIMYKNIKNTFLFLILKKFSTNTFSKLKSVVHSVICYNNLIQLQREKIVLYRVNFLLKEFYHHSSQIKIKELYELLNLFQKYFSNYYNEYVFYTNHKELFHKNKIHFMINITQKLEAFDNIISYINQPYSITENSQDESNILKLIDSIRSSYSQLKKKDTEPTLSICNTNSNQSLSLSTINILDYVKKAPKTRKNSFLKKKLSFEEIITPIIENKSQTLDIEKGRNKVLMMEDKISRDNPSEREDNSNIIDNNQLTQKQVNAVFQIGNNIISSDEEGESNREESSSSRIYNKLNITQFSFKKLSDKKEDIIMPPQIYVKKIIPVPVKEEECQKENETVIEENIEEESEQHDSPKFSVNNGTIEEIKEEKKVEVIVGKDTITFVNEMEKRLLSLDQEMKNLNVIEKITDETVRLCLSDVILSSHTILENHNRTTQLFYDNINRTIEKIEDSLNNK